MADTKSSTAAKDAAFKAALAEQQRKQKEAQDAADLRNRLLDAQRKMPGYCGY